MIRTTNSSAKHPILHRFVAVAVVSAVLGGTLLATPVHASSVDSPSLLAEAIPSTINPSLSTDKKEDVQSPSVTSGQEALDVPPAANLQEKETEQTPVVIDPDVQFIYSPDIPLSLELQQYTFDTAKAYGVDYTLVLAMMWRESNFNPNAIGTNSNGTRDNGLMQINDVNRGWLQQDLGITNLLDPTQNILAGIHMLGTMTAKHGSHNALLAYQYGEYGMQVKLSQGVTTNQQVENLYVKQAEFSQLILASQPATTTTTNTTVTSESL